MIFIDIYTRLKLTSILIVIAYLVVASSKKAKVRHGPTGMSHEDATNCSEFSKFGRFNPYSVLNEQWFVFYYWAPIRHLTTYIFTVPTASHIRRLKKVFEGNCLLPVQWHSRLLLMEDNKKFISLLVERSDRGEYWLYPVVKVITLDKITPRDVRLKQTGDNRVLGLMDCLDRTLLVMARQNDVPRKGHLHETAARLGYRGTKGKSYLYQGHEWGPVGEADEDDFWDRNPEKRLREKEEASEETKMLEGNSEEAETTPINQSQSEKPTKDKKTKRKKRTTVGPPDRGDEETCVKAMPELWDDPPENPNPNNLLTVDELKAMDDDTNDTSATEGPDDSNDKQVSIIQNDKLDNHEYQQKMEEPESVYQALQKKLRQDAEDIKKSENTLEKDEKSENTAKRATKTPENYKESENTLENKTTSENSPDHDKKLDNTLGSDKKSANTPEDNNKLENTSKFDKKSDNIPKHDEKPGDILEKDKKPENTMVNDKKSENTRENDNKSETTSENSLVNDKKSQNTPENVKKSENTPANDNKSENTLKHGEESENTQHNDNTCSGDANPDDENESCVVCYKSQVNYVSEDSYIPDSARSMPGLKDNEEAPPKEVPRVDVPSIKISGVEIPLNEKTSTEVPKVPKGKAPPAKITHKKGPVGKPEPLTLSPEQTNSSEVIMMIPKTIDELKSR